MKPTTVLMDEHRVIEQVLDCLAAMVKQCEADQRLDGESAEAALDFFREYADGCHHAKEEDLLFPLLETSGLPRQGGPTGVMMHEHEQGRACVRGMNAEIASAAQGDTQAINRFTQFANDFIELLRQHIDKEDHCLFPIAEQALSAEDQKALEASFDQVEERFAATQHQEKYILIADELAERFGVPKSRAQTADSQP